MVQIQGIEDHIIKLAGERQVIDNLYEDATKAYTARNACAWKCIGPFKYNIKSTLSKLNMSLPFPLFSTYNANGIRQSCPMHRFSFLARRQPA